jgi:hypothetical protein
MIGPYKYLSYYCLKNRIIGLRPKLGNTYYHISEHRKMRAKQQHVCKEMNQYTNNTNRKWFLSFSIEWTIGANDRK